MFYSNFKRLEQIVQGNAVNYSVEVVELSAYLNTSFMDVMGAQKPYELRQKAVEFSSAMRVAQREVAGILPNRFKFLLGNFETVVLLQWLGQVISHDCELATEVYYALLQNIICLRMDIETLCLGDYNTVQKIEGKKFKRKGFKRKIKKMIF